MALFDRPRDFNLIKLHRILRKLIVLLLALFTLRNVALLFFIFNFKTLPLAWELRIAYRAWQSWLDKRKVAKRLETAASKHSSANPVPSLPGSTHPLFAPVTISTTTQMLEMDHNLHKSNSTYFTDLDESRTALMFHLLSSTKFSLGDLDRKGITGRLTMILASVHVTFLKEIKPYERYTVRSRVLGWDNKWILTESVFVRPKNAADRRCEKKESDRKAKPGDAGAAPPQQNNHHHHHHHHRETGEVLLATCLSKYVMKKGRYTVAPEVCWRSAGWLPEKPDGGETPLATVDSSFAPTPDPEPVNGGVVKITEEDLRRRAQETAAKTIEKLKQTNGLHSDVKLGEIDQACLKAASRWSWAEIEAERARGMKIADNWFRVDRDLRGLWEGDCEKGIVS